MQYSAIHLISPHFSLRDHKRRSKGPVPDEAFPWDSSVKMINGCTIWLHANDKETTTHGRVCSVLLQVFTLDPVDMRIREIYSISDISRLKFWGHFLYWTSCFCSQIRCSFIKIRKACMYGPNFPLPSFSITNNMYNQIPMKSLRFAVTISPAFLADDRFSYFWFCSSSITFTCLEREGGHFEYR